MPIIPQSEIQVKCFKDIFKEIDGKCGEILAKFSVDFRPSISREIGHEKFHTNSSTHQDLKFHTAEPKFLHSDTLGVGGPNKVWIAGLRRFARIARTVWKHFFSFLRIDSRESPRSTLQIAGHLRVQIASKYKNLSNGHSLGLFSGRHEWRHLLYKGTKKCSKKFAATFKGKFLTRGDVLRIFFCVLRRFWGASIE